MSETRTYDVRDVHAHLVYEGSKGRLWAWWVATGAAGGALGAAVFDPGLGGGFWPLLLFLCAVVAARKAILALERLLLDRSAQVMGFAACAFWLAFVASAAGPGNLRHTVLTLSAGAAFGAVHALLLMSRVRRIAAWAGTAALAGASAAAGLWARAALEGVAAPFVAPAAAGALCGALYCAASGAALLRRFWDGSRMLALLGDKFYEVEDDAAALSCYELGLRVRPDDPDLHFGRGRALARQGLQVQSALAFERALSLCPNLALVYNDGGNDCLALDDPLRAIALYEKAVTLRPDFAMAYSNLGAVYEKLGRLDAALAEYDRALGLDPAYANGYSNRAFLHYRRGEYARALADCERALALEPEHAGAYSNRGLCRRRLGEAELAAADFRRALELPCPPAAWKEAGEGLRALGHKPPGVARWLANLFRMSRYF